MTKDADGTKRRARQIQRSPRAVANGWKYNSCLRIAQRELAIEKAWRQNFLSMGYGGEQIRLEIQKYRQENRERYEMPTKDPEGSDTRSDKEKRENQEQAVRDFLGEEPKKTDNPEGVPDSEGDAR